MRARGVIIASVIGGLALVACSNGGSNGGSTAGSGGGSGGSSGAGASGSAGGSATVAVTKGSLGRMLVDQRGRTLYMFLSDTSDKSTCYTGCSSTWPALTVTGSPNAGAGVQASMLGTTTRTDGSTQVTFDGHPLYVYSGDSGPGDVNGEGIGNVWYAVSPNGTPIKHAGGGGNGRYGY